jgi:hypothetical protein
VVLKKIVPRIVFETPIVAEVSRWNMQGSDMAFVYCDFPKALDSVDILQDLVKRYDANEKAVIEIVAIVEAVCPFS